MTPEVSIITVTFNHELYIDECIQSVVSQSFKNWEQIIINDGSTDNTLKKCITWSKIDHRIKIYSQYNKGLTLLSESYNIALSKCRGKYIAILEGDDFWAKEKLDVYINLLNSEKTVFAYGRSYLCNYKSEVFDIIPTKNVLRDKSVIKNTPPGNFYNLYLYKSIIPTATVIIKASTLESIGGFRQNTMSVIDYPTFLEIIPHGQFSFVDKPLSYYRISNNQATSNTTIDTGCSARYALTYYNSLNEFEKNRIKVSTIILKINIIEKNGLRNWHYGRIKYLSELRFEAIILFLKMLRIPTPKLFIISITSILIIVFGANLESFISKFGYRRLG